MLRQIVEHKVNPANDLISIVCDKPGQSGASHEYHCSWPTEEFNHISLNHLHLNFQNGPIGEVGVNGITHEALLAIIADRLRSFQAGPYACEENVNALNNIEAAQGWLKARTEGRVARGVEGTHSI